MFHVQSNTILCHSPCDTVFQIIKNSSDWPEYFEPCVKVRVIERTDSSEHIYISAIVNGSEVSWESKRQFFSSIYCIETEMVKPMPLVHSMKTTWNVYPLNEQQCMLSLEHKYKICDDVMGIIDGVDSQEDALRYMQNAIDVNSDKELSNIKALAECNANTLSTEKQWQTSHSIVCNTSADTVFSVIADVDIWPELIEACQKATVIAVNDGIQIVQIEALDGNDTLLWETHRRCYHDVFRVDFSLPKPMPFLKTMYGTWRVIPLDNNRSLLCVTRHFELLDDISSIRDDISTHEAAKAHINHFINVNAENEMQSFKNYVEKSYSESYQCASSYFIPYSINTVYDVFANVSEWPNILPHCNKINVLYDDTENQEFIMSVTGAQEDVTFRSIRHCDKNAMVITYFQPQPPAFMKAHSGKWLFKSFQGGTEVISQHSVTLNLSVCDAIFNDSDGLSHRKRIEKLVSQDSQKTLLACKSYLTQNG